MSETKWTAGQWVVSQDDNLIRADDDRHTVVCHMSASLRNPSVMADACLLASAPDLYAALAAICDEDCIDMERLTAGKAALRKARGEPA